MGYSYDKNRDRYIVRKTLNGTRYNLGRTKTPEEAEKMEADFDARVEQAKKDTLDNYKMHYEYENSGVQWLKAFRSLRTRLANRKLQQQADRETAAKIELM